MVAPATTTAAYVARAGNTKAILLDTRKTLPGLRLAQKYAVVCGGGRNHRGNLADGVLIKDNHVRACGSITEAVRRARANGAGGRVEVEVETQAEVREALAAGADVILLDNFAATAVADMVRPSPDAPKSRFPVACGCKTSPPSPPAAWTTSR